MRIRHARLVTALLATTAIGLGVVEIRANLAARTALHDVLATRDGLSVDTVFAEPLTGRLTLHHVRAGEGVTRITIGTLNLPLPRQNLGVISSALADTPGTASAQDVTVTSGMTVYRIKRVDLTGTSLSSPDLTSLLDPKSTETLEARLKKLTAASIVAPEIIADDTTPGSERHVVLTQVLLSNANAGKIAAGSAGGVTFTTKDGDETLNGSVGTIQATAVDLAQIAHVFGSVRTDEAEPILPLYDSLTVTAVKLTDDKKKSVFTLTALKETGAKARPLKTDAITAAKAGKEKLTDAQQAAVYTDVIHSFEFGSLEATDFAGQADAEDGSGTNKISLASVSLRGVAKAKVGGFSLRALRFDGAEVKFGLGTLDVGPFALPPPKSPAADPQASNAMMPSSGKLDMGLLDLDVNISGGEGVATHVQFKVAHVGLVSDGDPGDLPKTSKTAIDNITFDVPPNSAGLEPLRDMGYKHVDMSMGLITLYDAAAQSLMFHDLTVNGASMGSLAIGLHLVNVTKGLVSPNQEVVKASALAILAKSVALDLINDGLIDKAIAWKAKQDGLDVDKEKAFLIDFFDAKLPESLNNSANVKLVGGAIAKFIADPKNLHIAVESKSGLGVGSMALLSDPGLLIDSLDVKATANQ